MIHTLYYYYYYYHHHHYHHHCLLYAGYPHTHIPETNHVPRGYIVAVILTLLFMVPLFLRWLYCSFTLALSEVCVQCPIWLFSVAYYYYYYYHHYHQKQQQQINEFNKYNSTQVLNSITSWHRAAIITSFKTNKCKPNTLI